MIYCEDCSSYECGCPERKEIESLRQQLASRDAYIERLETGLLQVRKALCGDIHNTDDLLDLIASRDAEIAELKQQLETERLRLAACGVAALGYFDGCNDEYRSASLGDVQRLVEKNDQLRAQIKQKDAEIAELVYE